MYQRETIHKHAKSVIVNFLFLMMIELLNYRKYLKEKCFMLLFLKNYNCKVANADTYSSHAKEIIDLCNREVNLIKVKEKKSIDCSFICKTK